MVVIPHSSPFGDHALSGAGFNDPDAPYLISLPKSIWLLNREGITAYQHPRVHGLRILPVLEAYTVHFSLAKNICAPDIISP
jgi:hypothetical protein